MKMLLIKFPQFSYLLVNVLPQGNWIEHKVLLQHSCFGFNGQLFSQHSAEGRSSFIISFDGFTENTVIRGDALAVKHNLRGFDATHLACALIWRETLGVPVTLVSFDGQLIEVAREVQLACLPT